MLRDVLCSMLDCIDFMSMKVIPTVKEITEMWNDHSKVYAGLVDKVNVSRRADLDADILYQFPDLRTKVGKKLELLANHELSMLRLLIERMYRVNECFKIKLSMINSKLEQISFDEHNDIKHSIREHVMWLEDCWKCFHSLFMQLEFAMMSLQVLDEGTACNLVSAIKQEEKDKSMIGKFQTYKQGCLCLLKYLENKSKINVSIQ